MKTLFLLMAEYNSVSVELNKCYKHLGYNTPENAQRAASDYSLPVPWYRALDSQRSPRMVMLEDLANFIDEKVNFARQEYQAIRGGR